MFPKKVKEMTQAQKQFNEGIKTAHDRLKIIDIMLERYKARHKEINWGNVGDIGAVNGYLAEALLFLARGENQ